MVILVLLVVFDKNMVLNKFVQKFRHGPVDREYFRYSRVPNITVGLNKSVGLNFSWKLFKSIKK
jgi:hypothetical protein